MTDISPILLKVLLEIAGSAGLVEPQTPVHSCLDAIAATFFITLIFIGVLMSLGLWVERKARPTYNNGPKY